MAILFLLNKNERFIIAHTVARKSLGQADVTHATILKCAAILTDSIREKHPANHDSTKSSVIEAVEHLLEFQITQAKSFFEAHISTAGLLSAPERNAYAESIAHYVAAK